MEGSPGATVSWDDLVFVLDFLEGSGTKQISYLGGEPTIHPRFVDIVEYTLRRGFSCQVFTSGIIAPDRLAELDARIKPPLRQRLGFTCNINDPGSDPPADAARIEAFLNAFAEKVTLGYNIYRLDFDVSFILELIERHRLHRHVRLGLTHKMGDGGNLHIEPSEYRDVIKRLAASIPAFFSKRVTGGFDCGYPICAFDDADLGAFTRAGFHFKWGCSGAIDIGPDLRVWPCFPLSGLNDRYLLEFGTMAELNAHMQSVLGNKDMGPGIFDECRNCPMPPLGLCTGGCFGYRLPKAAQRENLP